MTTGQKLVVLGAGESGTGAAYLGLLKGYDVFVSEKLKMKDEYREFLRGKGIALEEGMHDEQRIFNADLIIKSPGIPDGISMIRDLRAEGKEVIDEIEFASRFAKGKIIAITGSNGKTTTTRLTWHILHSAGLDAALGGNIGSSFAKLLAEGEHEYYVLEVSSFQLDGCTTMRPYVSILTNITPDHLDRYSYKMENYVASKFRIIQSQQASDHFIYNNENENVVNYLNAYQGSGQPTRHPLGNSGFETAEGLQIGDFYIEKSRLKIKGRHNYHNVACAVTAAKLVGVSNMDIARALETFEADPHRMEPAGTVNGVEYINDSKATNVDSVFFALDAMTKPVIWIAGGQDKGNDYEVLLPLAKEKVKALICLGVDNSKLHDAFGGIVATIEDADSAQYAVQLAARLAQDGDVVLLSPACASFDLFNNYMDRGDQFKKAVSQL